MATFYQNGDSIDYTPVAAVTAGDVVALSSCIGIAKSDIAAGAKGALAVTGVFSVPAAQKGDGETWTQGAALYWNSSTSVFTSTAGSNQYAGYAVADGYIAINAGVAAA